MNEGPVKNIIIAPTLADATRLIIYRNNGEEIIVRIDQHKKTLASNNKLEIYEIDFIKNKTKINYKPSDWESCITKNINKAEKRAIVKVDKVIINQSEIKFIQELSSKPLQRLAFTLLCLSKYHNAVFEKNNNWVNCPVYQIFKLTGVANRTQSERLCMLNDLQYLILLEFGLNNIPHFPHLTYFSPQYKEYSLPNSLIS